MANLYDILGVQKNASQDDIKKAYKKLAIQNHPDKGGDEKKFQEISNAYDILGDQKKRQDYDNGGQQFRGRPNHEDIFAQMFGHKMNGMNNKNQKKQHSCSDINRNYKISLKDAYTGTIKNLKIKLKAYHFDKIKECNDCNGMGRIKNIQNMGIFTQIFEAPCNKCKTTGFIESNDVNYYHLL
jgi:DnaJ family protein A protein 2